MHFHLLIDGQRTQTSLCFASISNVLCLKPKKTYTSRAISSVGRVKPLASLKSHLCSGLRGVRASSDKVATRRASVEKTLVLIRKLVQSTPIAQAVEHRTQPSTE